MSTMTVDVFNLEKKKCGEIQLNTFVFQQDPRLDIISELVRAGQGKKRQGSHNVKTRAEVRGGGAKPFRQKGTGRARQGSSRSPLLRAGGVIHGPKPRKYSKKIGTKVRKLGIRSTLSYLFSKGVFVVVEDMISKEGKTKDLHQKLKNFSSKSLLVDHNKNELFSRACRNLSSYQLLEACGLNVYDLLKYNHVICTRNAVEKIHKIYGQDLEQIQRRETAKTSAAGTAEQSRGSDAAKTSAAGTAEQKHKSESVKASAAGTAEQKHKSETAKTSAAGIAKQSRGSDAAKTSAAGTAEQKHKSETAKTSAAGIAKQSRGSDAAKTSAAGTAEQKQKSESAKTSATGTAKQSRKVEAAKPRNQKHKTDNKTKIKEV